jgi:hypothetical protein
VILAIPIHATFAVLDHRAPWGLVSLRGWNEERTSKSSNVAKIMRNIGTSILDAGDNTEQPVNIRRYSAAARVEVLVMFKIL